MFTVHRAVVHALQAALPAQEVRLLPLDHRPGRAPAVLAHPVVLAAPGEAENRKESELVASLKDFKLLIGFATGQVRAGAAVPMTKERQALLQRRAKIKIKSLMRNPKRRKSQNLALGPDLGIYKIYYHVHLHLQRIDNLLCNVIF